MVGRSNTHTHTHLRPGDAARVTSAVMDQLSSFVSQHSLIECIWRAVRENNVLDSIIVRKITLVSRQPSDEIIRSVIVSEVEQSLCLQLWQVSLLFDYISQSDTSNVVAYWGDDEQQVISGAAWGLPLCRYPDWLRCVCTKRGGCLHSLLDSSTSTWSRDSLSRASTNKEQSLFFSIKNI